MPSHRSTAEKNFWATNRPTLLTSTGRRRSTSTRVEEADKADTSSKQVQGWYDKLKSKTTTMTDAADDDF